LTPHAFRSSPEFVCGSFRNYSAEALAMRTRVSRPISFIPGHCEVVRLCSPPLPCHSKMSKLESIVGGGEEMSDKRFCGLLASL
jgi:hypothetical protein